MFWLKKVRVLSLKEVVVLGSVLTLLISGRVSANCGKAHYDSKEYKHIPGLMALHFSDLDTDGDDRISIEEFNSSLTTSGETSFKHLDNDSSSGLDRGEWNAFKVMHTGMGSHHGNHRGKRSKNIRQAGPDPSAYNAHFEDMDSNDDGVVETKEFSRHFSGYKNNNEFFTTVDLNNDSQIDHGEWHAFKKAHNLGHKE